MKLQAVLDANTGASNTLMLPDRLRKKSVKDKGLGKVEC
jgi:hypothetical protein